jgi:hypothetical protein
MNKKNRIILAGILALLLVTYLILRLNRPEEKTRSLFGLNPQKIDKIEIWEGENRVDMALIEGIWKISEPVVWNADSTKVAGFFADVISAKYATTPMSLGPEAPNRYNLQEDSAMHVRVSSGAKSVYVLFSNMGNPWDYFRFADDDKVYQVKSKVVQSYQPLMINWRSPIVLQYFEEDLAVIRSKHANNDYTLTRDGSRWMYQDASKSFDVYFDNFALIKIISVLQNMRTYIFADGRDEHFTEAFKSPELEVWITDVEGDTRKLSFVKVDNERYMMMVDDDPHVLYQMGFDTVFRFMRNPEIFRRVSG